MLYGLYTSGLAAIGQSARLDVVANNLANANTTGFRRDQVSFQERLVEALEDTPDFKHYNSLVHRHGGAPFLGATAFDSEAGGIEITERPLDFAINGKGFFVVRDRNTGKNYYTRAGNFVTDSQGAVVTPDGKYQLMGEGDSAVTVEPTVPLSEVRLDADGNLRQGDEVRARLAVVDFADPRGVRKHGDNLFENFGTEVVETTDYRLVQSALEGSTVDPVSEMVEMIKTIRMIEANLQMIHIQDGSLERLVNDFGRPAR